MSEVKKAGYNKLENIAQRLKIQGFQAHNAIDDVAVLNKIIVALKMSNNQIEKQIIELSLKWNAVEEKILLSDKCNSIMKLYDELKGCTSVQMRKRMIACDITVNMVIDTYKQYGFDGLTRFLGQDENDYIRVTKNKKVKDKLVEFLKTKC